MVRRARPEHGRELKRLDEDGPGRRGAVRGREGTAGEPVAVGSAASEAGPGARRVARLGHSMWA